MKKFLQLILLSAALTLSAASLKAQNGDMDCMAPENVMIERVSNALTWVSWDAVDNADYYEVSYSNDAGITYRSWKVFGRTIHPLLNLDNNDEYVIRVRTRCENGGWSDYRLNIINSPQNELQCFTPQGLRAGEVTYNSAWIHWNVGLNHQHYRYGIRMAGHDEYMYDETSTTNFYAGDLEPETTYEVVVRAKCDEDLYSDWSSFSFTTPAEPQNPVCGTPNGLMVGDVMPHEAHVMWNAVLNSTYYTVRYREVGTRGYRYFYTIRPHFMLHGLSGATDYEVQVRNRCHDYPANSAWSETVTFRTMGNTDVCAQPVILNAQPKGEYADITWYRVANATNYHVRYHYAGGVWMDMPNVLTNSVRIPNLRMGKNYTVQIMANCAGVRSQFSEPVRFSTPYFRTGADAEAANAFSIYPNPASDFASVRYNATTAVSGALVVTDLAGKTVLAQDFAFEAGQNEISIDTKALGSGVYMVAIRGEGVNAAQKLVVQ